MKWDEMGISTALFLPSSLYFFKRNLLELLGVVGPFPSKMGLD